MTDLSWVYFWLLVIALAAMNSCSSLEHLEYYEKCKMFPDQIHCSLDQDDDLVIK